MITQLSSEIVRIISERLEERNDKGFETYNETLDDVPFDNYDWNMMAMEEVLDFAQYILKENNRLKYELQNKVEMTLNMFQEKSERTMPQKDTVDDILLWWTNMDKSNFALGLNGESGELGDLVKKNVHHGHPFNRPKFVEEAGDVLFYLAGLCTMYGVTLEEVGIMNLHKLRKRYEKGFNKEDSIRRVDVNEK